MTKFPTHKQKKGWTGSEEGSSNELLTAKMNCNLTSDQLMGEMEKTRPMMILGMTKSETMLKWCLERSKSLLLASASKRTSHLAGAWFCP